MLEFNLSFTKSEIKPEENTAVVFQFKNLQRAPIHIISYQFRTSKGDTIIQAFNKHPFIFSLLPFQLKEKKFGEVNASEVYLGTNTNEGDYKIEVTIEYFICGEDKIYKTKSDTNLCLVSL